MFKTTEELVEIFLVFLNVLPPDVVRVDTRASQRRLLLMLPLVAAVVRLLRCLELRILVPNAHFGGCAFGHLRRVRHSPATHTHAAAVAAAAQNMPLQLFVLEF